MKNSAKGPKVPSTRRSFIRTGLAVGATAGAGFVAKGSTTISAGDAAILQFLSAAEIIETDLWIQYNELGGTQDSEVPGITGGSDKYIKALEVLDGDMPQYIHDNTEDEISHFTFINAYLSAKGSTAVNLDQFRTLPSSKATGARQIGRLTNLMQLSVDTSWWTRYQSGFGQPNSRGLAISDRQAVGYSPVPSARKWPNSPFGILASPLFNSSCRGSAADREPLRARPVTLHPVPNGMQFENALPSALYNGFAEPPLATFFFEVVCLAVEFAFVYDQTFQKHGAATVRRKPDHADPLWSVGRTRAGVKGS